MPELTMSRSDGTIEVRSGDVSVARYVVDAEIAPIDTPKPFFHPLRTLGGAQVTGFGPEDHPWHHGLQFAIPRVGGHNLWGGGTYLGPVEGYKVQEDQGSIRHDEWDAAAIESGAASIRHRFRTLKSSTSTRRRRWTCTSNAPKRDARVGTTGPTWSGGMASRKRPGRQ